jgi:hypothetical protein
LLFKHVGKTTDIYHCPADRRVQGVNVAYLTFSIAGGANGENREGYNKARRYSDLKNPAEKYVFVEEADSRSTNVGSWQFHFRPLAWIDLVAMWHKRQTTLGYADGRSEMHRWNDQSLIDWSREAMCEPLSFSFDMTPPADELKDVTFMQGGFPCRPHR